MKLHKGILVLSVFLFFGIAVFADGKPAVISKSESAYLIDLAEATLNGLMYFTNAETGLPYDVSDGRKPTSISNIGLYMACLAIGGKTGIIDDEKAVENIGRALDSLEKIEVWNGFPITWVSVETLKRNFGPSFSYADHVGNLVCGLLVVSGAYPEQFKARVDAIIGKMQFDTAYDPATGWLKGGYNLEKKDFDVQQSWGKWYYNLLAADTRHFSLIAITLGKVPDYHWTKLLRETYPANNLDRQVLAASKDNIYYSPGMMGGGLFMQYLPGIFLEEINLPMGESARNLARAELDLSKELKYYPLWGISASEAPDARSYLGWDSLRPEVVTPHACVLAVADFPKDTVKCLKALQKAGARPAYEKDGVKHDFGFTDSYDIENKISSKNYLSLDQSMLYLSLANFLYDGIVRKTFAKTGLGAKAADKLGELELGRKLK